MTTHDIELAAGSFIAGMVVIRITSWLMDGTEMSEEIETISNSNLIVTSASVEKIHKDINAGYIQECIFLMNDALIALRKGDLLVTRDRIKEAKKILES